MPSVYVCVFEFWFVCLSVCLSTLPILPTSVLSSRPCYLFYSIFLRTFPCFRTVPLGRLRRFLFCPRRGSLRPSSLLHNTLTTLPVFPRFPAILYSLPISWYSIYPPYLPLLSRIPYPHLVFLAHPTYPFYLVPLTHPTYTP